MVWNANAKDRIWKRVYESGGPLLLAEDQDEFESLGAWCGYFGLLSDDEIGLCLAVATYLLGLP